MIVVAVVVVEIRRVRMNSKKSEECEEEGDKI